MVIGMGRGCKGGIYCIKKGGFLPPLVNSLFRLSAFNLIDDKEENDTAADADKNTVEIKSRDFP